MILRTVRFVVSFFVLLSWAEAAVTPPNIIFLLADDLRADALGCYGNRIVQTPNIDRLASQGVRFRNHFVTTSICNVSRASIFTGQYLRRHGIVDFATPFTHTQWQATYPALLRQHGYRTGFIGKFGVGSNDAVEAMSDRFDFWRGLPAQAGLFFDKNDPTRTHKTARFGNEALEFLRECNTNKPFCLSVSFNAPHARDRQPREFWPDPRDESLYTNTVVPRPPRSDERWFQRLPASVQESESRARWKLRFTNDQMFQRTVRDYYRLITGIDREVGRIADLLHERGFATNTVIVFTSDNGFFLGERGLADKWFMYEESIRVPLVVFDPRVPGEQRGRLIDALTLNIDFAPTLLEFAGVAAPEGMQGRSLVPLVQGTVPADWRKEFFYEHHTLPKIIPRSEGVRTEGWKYLRWIDETPVVEELYDLASDPGEENNLASDPKHAKVVRELRERWKTLGTTLK
jgi:arylsulfatase A-like enzyme